MAITTKQVVKDVTISDIRVGDKLLQDIVGVENRTLIMQGTFISPREVIFLRKQLSRTKPKRPPERYQVGLKTPGAIYDKNGACLVRAGVVVTEAALAPLLEEGFEQAPLGEGGMLFYRKSEMPAGQPWHITDFNPAVRVETTSYLDAAGQEAADPRGDKMAVGGKPAAPAAKAAVKA